MALQMLSCVPCLIIAALSILHAVIVILIIAGIPQGVLAVMSRIRFGKERVSQCFYSAARSNAAVRRLPVL